MSGDEATKNGNGSTTSLNPVPTLPTIVQVTKALPTIVQVTKALPTIVQVLKALPTIVQVLKNCPCDTPTGRLKAIVSTSSQMALYQHGCLLQKYLAVKAPKELYQAWANSGKSLQSTC